MKDPFFQLVPTGPSDLIIDGEVVFAGYGIKADKYKYNDFGNLKTEGKILLVMDRAPMSEDGKKCQFEEPNWTTSLNFQMKLTALMFSKAKAILFVPDPKSGFQSFSEVKSRFYRLCKFQCYTQIRKRSSKYFHAGNAQGNFH